MRTMQAWATTTYCAAVVEDDREKEADRRANDRRLIFTALIAPVIMLAVTIYLASQGVQS
ncbi:hypothetical protein ACFYWY_06460 [Streptomyces sp. NPDC002870]|uniref:hypothetical protein n=1 Tax=Streptomyces sp. NPDC002870 TaxID=3364666 RepID=UPI003696094C